jgi:cysteine desulfurase
VQALEKEGYRVTYLPVQKDGLISLDDLRNAVTDKTILITIMTANNEIGVVQPIAEIGAIAKEKGILFHTDAGTGGRQDPVQRQRPEGRHGVHQRAQDVRAEGCRRALRPPAQPARPAVAHHRRWRPRARMRSGTLNVPGIVGFGKAAELCRQEMAAEAERLKELCERLNTKLHEGLDEIYINGSVAHRLPHNLNISFAYVEGESLLMGINDVAVSSGSACTSASLEPSYVLKALGAGDDLAHSSIRFGLGRWTTAEEVDYVANKLISVVTRLREMSPLYELAKEGVDLSTMQWEVH